MPAQLREAEFKNIPLPDENSPDGKALSAKNGNFFSSASLNSSSQYIPLLKLASKLLKGSYKRLFMAEVSEALRSGNARLR
jgi:hypothetical protein